MGQPAAKQGDKVTAKDMHMIQPPPVATPVLVPHPFVGIIDGGLSSDVNIMGMPAATMNSTASNTPPHLPSGGTFVKPPANKATIIKGSTTVFINGKAAARSGDTATTCNDPADVPGGTVVAVGTVMIG
jgi:uncharacterized Zn-binding protein involved in type VI secretion